MSEEKLRITIEPGATPVTVDCWGRVFDEETREFSGPWKVDINDQEFEVFPHQHIVVGPDGVEVRDGK
ncbi:MAG TPA: hypothetical protein VLV83_09185 [Acidobacteriota bacterium]|nr:hypothetical protein [Acidobacteriota bacterium]